MGNFATWIFLGSLAYAAHDLGAPLRDAARDGNLVRVQQLVAEDPKLVNSTDQHRFTPLHWAAGGGHKDVMTFLLDHGADPNARSDMGMTPLFLLKDGRKDQMAFLADRGADLRAKSDNGWTALHTVAQRGDEDGAAYLIAQGLGVDDRCKGPFGTPLSMAAANGRVGVAKLLLEKGADVNSRTDEGNTPLHEAALRGKAEMVRLLLGHHADVNARRPKGARSPGLREDGGTPLHDAVAFGQEEVVGSLLAGGADVNARSDHGRTPLHLASAKDRMGVVKRLLEGKADVKAFDESGLTPLHAIVLGGDAGSVALLLERGAEVDVRSKQSAVVPILSAKGPEPRAWESTPLHLASWVDRKDVVKLLISKNADVNARNSLGQTPLKLAKSDAVKGLLRESGGRDE